MIIHERSVTEVYWRNMYDYIMRRIATARYHDTGYSKIVNVHGSPTTTTYAILENDMPVAWLYLARRPKWAVWEVRQVFVFPELRGRGLARRLYYAAINQTCHILASGKTQSKSSRALWRRFIQEDTFQIWAQDFNNLDLRADVVLDDGELYSTLPIYTREQTKHDVRLIAIRK